MNKISYLKLSSLIVGLLVLLGACQKTEFMPDPIGEEIPAPVYPSLKDALPEQASLFKEAWRKADMDAVLATEQAQAKLTFLVPNNTAMEAAGYTAAAIQGADKTTLRKLLRYHLLNGTVGLEQLRLVLGDLSFPTLLQHPKFLDGEIRDGSLIRTVPYKYMHLLNVKDGKLIVDGKPLAVDKELDVAQGKAILINQFLVAPQQQMYDFLLKDGRFSLYLKAMELNNIEYENEFMLNMSYGFPVPMRFLLDWNYYFEGTFHSNEIYPRHIIHMTLFAPTDNAFNQVGIYTEEDLKALNGRIPTPSYYVRGQSTPIDSLLRYQYIGSAASDIGYNDDYTEFCYVVTSRRFVGNAMFFSQMLDDKLLAVHQRAEEYPVDHRFGHNGSRIKVSHIKSKQQNATIIQENINTIQGPVHVVDQILVPDDFSMWHKKK